MTRARAVCVTTVLGLLLATTASSKKITEPPVPFEAVPSSGTPLPRDLLGKASRLSRVAAAADTFILHEEDFDDANGQPTTGGYTTVDRTDQAAAFFHVADNTELDGGASGALAPLSGARSMWCGQAPSGGDPFCNWATLPGYGNDWDQVLESDVLAGDSVSVSYKVYWDSEPGYDRTAVQYNFDNGPFWYLKWKSFPVNDSWSTDPDVYDNTSPRPYIAESLVATSAGATIVRIRFHFTSDGGWSDEDGLWPTDGAVLVDDIAVATWSGGVMALSDNQDFESVGVGSNTAGIWTGKKGPSFGDYAELYPGVTLLQEDPCTFVTGFVWGFFDTPANTRGGYFCHIPDPRPDVGVVPYGKAGGIYIHNEIWSPRFPNSGSGNDYRLRFLVYRDLPVDPFVTYQWHVRSWNNGCPGRWRDHNFVYFGAGRDWFKATFNIGSLVDPNADELQIAVGARDMCGVWCGIFHGGPPCQGHAPLIDDIEVQRIAVFGPQYTVQHVNLFQDNFAKDGTLTGKARADAAMDTRHPELPGIIPGDSVAVTISGIGVDPNTGVGPAAYLYTSVWPTGQVAKTPAHMEAPETRAGAGGKRWPLVGTRLIDGNTWACFRMDNVVNASGAPVANRYCIDLNDAVFTPGDTICYFFGADGDGTPNNGNESYWSREMNGQGAGFVTDDIAEVAASPCEFTMLPAGGYNRGGDILYVDDTDDRGGPAQLFWDSAFDMLGIRDLVDRYDVLGPSSTVDNSLASRVKNNTAQIVDVYQKILWDSGNLTSGLLGDGTGGPEKSNDWGLLFQFLNTSTLGAGPGLYLSGDDLAEEWVTRTGPSAIQTRSTYMNFNLLRYSQIVYGESISPMLTASGASFVHSGVPDKIVAYGDCPFINDFDVLQPTGTAITEFPYPTTGKGAVVSQQTLNSVGKTATVVLSGFSYATIREAVVGFPPTRVEYLRDILTKMGNVVPNATGVDPGDAPQYVNILHNNYPNPFNPVTTIRYGIKERGHVSLKIYNAAGQLVKTLVDEMQAPDAIEPVTWDGRNSAGQIVSSGVYFYRLVTKDFSQTRKMVLLK